MELLHDLHKVVHELFVHFVNDFAAHSLVNAVWTLLSFLFSTSWGYFGSWGLNTVILGDRFKRIPTDLRIGHTHIVANELAHVL